MDDGRRPRSRGELRRECEAAVASWEWGTLYLHDYRPHYALRWGFRPPRKLPKAPKKLASAREYGLDGEGRLRVERKYRDASTVSAEVFYVPRDGAVDDYRFGEGANGEGGSYELAGGKIARWEQPGAAGAQSESYVWDGDRVTRVEHSEPSGRQRVFEIDYDATGAVSRVRSPHPSGETTVVFEAPTPGLPELLAAMKQQLSDAVVAVLQDVACNEPAYCLALVYSADYYMLPPEIGLGLERERSAWVAAGQQDRIWSPEDWSPFAAANRLQDTPSLADLGRAIGDHLRSEGSEEPAIGLLVEVAKQLAGPSLEGVLDTTDNFVVCALSVEGGLNHQSLKSIPRRLQTKLRKAGLIPK
jgi:hypothetical protein